jgi:hypothetical protein
LGVLYVVDSVTRKWLEQAKAQGQAINSAAPDGTYAAGVHRVTELMPVLMNDIIQTAPDDQKVRNILNPGHHNLRRHHYALIPPEMMAIYVICPRGLDAAPFLFRL